MSCSIVVGARRKEERAILNKVSRLEGVRGRWRLRPLSTRNGTLSSVTLLDSIATRPKRPLEADPYVIISPVFSSSGITLKGGVHFYRFALLITFEVKSLEPIRPFIRSGTAWTVLQVVDRKITPLCSTRNDIIKPPKRGRSDNNVKNTTIIHNRTGQM